MIETRTLISYPVLQGADVDMRPEPYMDALVLRARGLDTTNAIHGLNTVIHTLCQMREELRRGITQSHTAF